MDLYSKFEKPFNHKEVFYGEDYFRDLLVRERKRTKRSGKPFILMLLNIQELLLRGTNQKTLRKVVHTICSSTRETDIRGWYKQDHSIGIIFTELNGDDAGNIKAKMHMDFDKNINWELLKKIIISFHMYPEGYGTGRMEKSKFDQKLYPDLSGDNSDKMMLRLKRTMDIIGSLFCIIILSPVFFVVPILIKLTSRGTVIFKQKRMGEKGKKFTFYKFRTMYADNDNSHHRNYVKQFILDDNGDQNSNETDRKLYKMNNDPRVTPVGNFLRKTSIDEIPQFYNVLKGDMSLVGPRPPIPYELEHYDLWHRQRILYAKPGITGVWQVEGRSLVDFNDMVRMDIKYIRECNVMLDAKILIKTPLAVILFKGAF